MSLKDLFQAGKHSRKVAHFASIVRVAEKDGKMDAETRKVLQRFATKLEISPNDCTEILNNEFLIEASPTYNTRRRLEYIHDIFSIVYTKYYLNEKEQWLLEGYAVHLGYTNAQATEIIKKSMEIFSGRISYKDYGLVVKAQLEATGNSLLPKKG